jgi:hypothetical protein
MALKGTQRLEEVSGDIPVIEVGETEGTLRLWRAKEAVRQAELTLAGQEKIKTALEARSTAMTGWAATAFLAAAGAAVAAQDHDARVAAIAAGVPLAITALACIAANRPRGWTMPGLDPDLLLAAQEPTELEILERVAKSLGEGIFLNDKRLNNMVPLIRRAGWALSIAPAVAVVAYLIAAK